MKLTMGEPPRGTLTAPRIDCSNPSGRQLQPLIGWRLAMQFPLFKAEIRQRQPQLGDSSLEEAENYLC
jgi:hypothetical protein